MKLAPSPRISVAFLGVVRRGPPGTLRLSWGLELNFDMEALPFLSSANAKLGPLYVVHGDEAFLKRQVIRTLIKRALGDDADVQTVSTYAGDKAIFAEVFDELDTVPFFDPKRVVIIEERPIRS